MQCVQYLKLWFDWDSIRMRKYGKMENIGGVTWWTCLAMVWCNRKYEKKNMSNRHKMSVDSLMMKKQPKNWKYKRSMPLFWIFESVRFQRFANRKTNCRYFNFEHFFRFHSIHLGNNFGFSKKREVFHTIFALNGWREYQVVIQQHQQWMAGNLDKIFHASHLSLFIGQTLLIRNFIMACREVSVFGGLLFVLPFL